ncbi:pilus assembly protein PilP [Neptuniibacter sp. SY11_33]|uniref:pilus assembly protein PilP n=1 Tax=Neptuniibacter sp. SY11_33 TaxID=3398215 RepID=UPI0039F4E8E0
MKLFIKVVSISLLLFPLSGCVDWVDDTTDLKKYVAKMNKLPGGKIDALPEFKPYNNFVYEGASMREPFRAVVPVVEEELLSEKDEQSNELQPNDNRVKDYLETFPIDSLTMVGTINQQEGSLLWALIRDQNSEIHRVTVGNYMGLHHGEIVSLDERQVHLIEIIRNGRGGWKKRTRSIALNEPE